MLDLIVKGGRLVGADSSINADIAVKDGKIAAIGNHRYFSESTKVIDAAGKLVMPGLIDSHVHIGLEMGEFTTLDTVENATMAAAYGGTTSMVEFAIPVGEETPLTAVEKTKNAAQGHSVIDYSFHSCITRHNEQSLADIRDLLSGGIPSVKMFTIYKDTVMLPLLGVYEVLGEIAKQNGIAMIHAENAPMIEALIERFVAQGKTTPWYHAMSRPPVSEVEAVAGMISLIRDTGAPVIFAHMTCAEVAEFIRDAKRRYKVYSEFCPHYLALTKEVYQSPVAERFVCSPPMRDKENLEGLWRMVAEGLCDIISSDHSAYDTEQKMRYKDNFTKMPNGLPGIETRAIVAFSEGVAGGRISENDFVRMLSTNDAKLMGMYPQKGILAPGADADMILIDPQEKYTLRAQDLHMQTDYTPFEGLSVTGRFTHTILRGNVLIEDCTYTGAILGEQIPRHTPDLY